ncbi:aminotransferase class V-fold PLP-dependent enzyme [Bordetella sp. BOR01]|uniref:aminotransferase class V-fold PLP-dependent enzyme n=1 Tax=Bordetella sp. BOR01 TaxID=2854779 RepID=UPI001C448FED|nr:aminotransferase class V-fold PLP-dependent enzyme [Bordetella sp. BOR01]MBV7481477.1 aminotransferase class V-fold PLP-dependent enzyme [Bordetella sp. BOR01]
MPQAALSDADVERLRQATPGVARIVHFNHAGSSLPSAATVQAVVEHLQREAAMGPMEAGQAVQDILAAARQHAASLIGAQADEVAFASGCSDAWGCAFAALGPWQPGDRILVGRHEWGGNLATLQQVAGRAGARIEPIPCDETGCVSPQALAAMLDERVRLISLTWLPANGGLINPAAEIGAIARRHGIPYIVDAAQALGQLPIDVRTVGCDLLAAPVRKHLRGPRGLALLYVRNDFAARLAPAFVDTSSAPMGLDGVSTPRTGARRLETSEQSVALLCGLANALQEALELGVDAIRARIDANATQLRERLARIPGVTLHDLGRAQSALVSFNIEGMAAADVRSGLARQGINITANGVPYTPLDMRARGLDVVARASVSYLTSGAELDRLVVGVTGLTAR